MREWHGSLAGALRNRGSRERVAPCMWMGTAHVHATVVWCRRARVRGVPGAWECEMPVNTLQHVNCAGCPRFVASEMQNCCSASALTLEKNIPLRALCEDASCAPNLACASGLVAPPLVFFDIALVGVVGESAPGSGPRRRIESWGGYSQKLGSGPPSIC